MMTSLPVICGLGPPNQKSWLRLWSGGGAPAAGGYGGLEAKPPAAGRFLCVFGKKAILIPLDHISYEFKAI